MRQRRHEPLPRPLLSRLHDCRDGVDDLSLQTSTDGGLTWSQPVTVAPLPLAGAIPAVQPNGTVVIVYDRVATARAWPPCAHATAAQSRATRVVDLRSRRGRGRLRPPLLAAVRRPERSHLADWQDCRSAAALPRERRRRLDVDRRGRLEQPRRVTSGRKAAIPTIGAETCEPAAGDPLLRRPSGRNRCRARRVAGRRRPGARRNASMRADAACLDPQHHPRTDACGLHLRLVRRRAAARRLGARIGTGAAPSSGRRSTATRLVVLTGRSDARRS